MTLVMFRLAQNEFGLVRFGYHENNLGFGFGYDRTAIGLGSDQFRFG